MSVKCALCGQDTNWMTTSQVASLRGVTDGRIRQLCNQGRFPGAEFVEGIHKTGMWKIPASAVIEAYRREA